MVKRNITNNALLHASKICNREVVGQIQRELNRLGITHAPPPPLDCHPSGQRRHGIGARTTVQNEHHATRGFRRQKIKAGRKSLREP